MNGTILKINSINDVDKIDDIECYRFFDSEPTINKDMLIHLLSGKPLVDITDGENVHLIQIDSESIEFISNIFNSKRI